MTARARLTAAILGIVALEIALILFVDRPLSQSLRGLDAEHKALIDFFRSWTDLGKSLWYLWPSGLGAAACLLLSRHGGRASSGWHRAGLKFSFFFCSVALAGIIADLIKPFLGRARPVLLGQSGIYGFYPLDFHSVYNSMPSGHTTTAFAVACALIRLWPRGTVLFLSYAAALAASRVMVNAHFLSDVLAGAAVGIFRQHPPHGGCSSDAAGASPVKSIPLLNCPLVQGRGDPQNHGLLDLRCSARETAVSMRGD